MPLPAGLGIVWGCAGVGLLVGGALAYTLGRRLVEKQREVRIFGEPMTVRAEVSSLDELSGHADQGELMGLRHKTLPIEGVQFHPESIMTGPGNILLHNFLRPDYEQLLRTQA